MLFAFKINGIIIVMAITTKMNKFDTRNTQPLIFKSFKPIVFNVVLVYDLKLWEVVVFDNANKGGKLYF